MGNRIGSVRRKSRFADVKVDPTELVEFLELVRKASLDELDVSERTKQMWLIGEVPKVVKLLMERPDLALALWRDSERRALRRETTEAER